MPSSDPLSELAPFLEANRASASHDRPPDYLTARLIESRTSGIGPAISPIPEEDLPRRFGPYTLGKVLGRGASGTVYEALDTELDRRIAVKILSPQLATLPEARERFLREAQAAAGLQHDHLMPVFAVHQNTPSPCLTMPLLQGETLQQKINRDGPFPDDLLVKIAHQIASGLACAHQSHILHRDLKPSNIFFETPTQRAIIMDFGLARSLHQPSDLTVSGAIAGTPEFLAPEQIDDVPNLTPATDLYALGATLYSLASGQPPFTGHSLTGLLKKVAMTPPEPLKNRPPWLNQLILSLLSKEAAQRPKSAEKILGFLKHQNAPSATSRNRRLLLAGAALILPGLLIWTIFPLHKAGAKAEVPPFSLSAAITSAPSEIVIPKNGIYELDPIQLDRDLTFIATEEGTILRFTSAETPLTTTGSLTFKNLTLRDDLPQESEARHLIISTGESITFENCRLEQSGRESHPLIQPPLIKAETPLSLTLQNSDIVSFRTPLFQAASGSQLTLTHSLAFIPALMIADQSAGHSVTLDHAQAVCLSLLITSATDNPTHIRSNHSIFEVNHAFIWAPGAQSENLEQTVRWTGDHNSFATTRTWLSTAQTRRRNRKQLEADLEGLHQWQNFWESDANSQETAPVILPMNLPNTVKHPSELDTKAIKEIVPN